jgi:chromosome segregation ATPase
MIVMWAAISVGFCFAVVVLWQRLGRVQTALAEAHSKLAAATAFRLQLESSISALNEQVGTSKKSSEKLQRECVALKEKLARASLERVDELRDAHGKIAELSDRLEHHHVQERALTAQLQGIDQSNREFRKKWEEKIASAEALLTEQKAGFQEQLAHLRREVRAAEQRCNRLTEELSERAEQREEKRRALAEEKKREAKKPTDEVELEKLHGRLNQAEKLYQMMRSHKEITAERNDYLVKICNILASAVIDYKQPETPKPDNFGPLVNMAIGLVRNQESAHAPQ